MTPAFVNREFFYLAPEIFLTVWGVLVLVFDFSFLRTTSDARRNRILGMGTLVGVLLTLLVGILSLVPELDLWGSKPLEFLTLGLAEQDYSLFGGTLAADSATAFLNLLVLVLLALTVGLSMSWEFTRHIGEYYALLIWSTVGMMLLIAAEELVTLFLTLEMMTLCLYMMTSLEKSKRRSAEGGLKYFVYGSVSSALFLFGLSLIYGLTGTTLMSGVRAALGASGTVGLQGHMAGAAALLLVLVGLGFRSPPSPSTSGHPTPTRARRLPLRPGSPRARRSRASWP